MSKAQKGTFRTTPKVEVALKKLYDCGICKDADNTPTPWVSPIVVVPRLNDTENMRTTLDMRAANHAIKHVKHPMPTIDEPIHNLNGVECSQTRSSSGVSSN